MTTVPWSLQPPSTITVGPDDPGRAGPSAADHQPRRGLDQLVIPYRSRPSRYPSSCSAGLAASPDDWGKVPPGW